ncbi:hypothetical protein [Aureimonas phyllosphaerae]|uniref:Putative ABC-class ATPase n=1 Tax=Aureimonas phyllosphaerae TaxID=1166078 RepID=A0A7W6BVI3_9HYPH|nr:hypothetical protein [Aureimonas phyllosphaerae]MBB3937687.1 putative ABC-class ATPase [Aureimonas phyllosphaerae]MBB3961778.1 putative ABC-class ATPase [Aureimonas phyllosphaerae]SFF45094.1 hypothetical protein SAMN05216566_11426 [Aureimonas phyllosphaerae]
MRPSWRRRIETPLARVRRIISERAASLAAAALLARIEVADGDILTLTMGSSLRRVDEIRMQLALRKRLDDRGFYRASVVLLDADMVLRVERIGLRPSAE